MLKMTRIGVELRGLKLSDEGTQQGVCSRMMKDVSVKGRSKTLESYDESPTLEQLQE